MNHEIFLRAAFAPFLYLLVFAFIVAPITFVLWRIIPDGKLKIFLFRIRDGSDANWRDKLLHWCMAILAFAIIFGLGWYYDR